MALRASEARGQYEGIYPQRCTFIHAHEFHGFDIARHCRPIKLVVT